MLSAFLAVHVTAVLAGRAALGLDTNFYFAAAGFHVARWGYFFAPYYFVGVVALFAQVTCASAQALRDWSDHARVLALATPLIVGVGLALLFVMSLGGYLFPIEIPPEYKAPYLQYPARTFGQTPADDAQPCTSHLPADDRTPMFVTDISPHGARCWMAQRPRMPTLVDAIRAHAKFGFAASKPGIRVTDEGRVRV